MFNINRGLKCVNHLISCFSHKWKSLNASYFPSSHQNPLPYCSFTVETGMSLAGSNIHQVLLRLNVTKGCSKFVYVKKWKCWLLSYVWLCDNMDCKLTRLLCPWNSPGKKTGMRSHSLLQGIFLMQGSSRFVSQIAGRFFTVWATREEFYVKNLTPNPPYFCLPRERACCMGEARHSRVSS